MPDFVALNTLADTGEVSERPLPERGESESDQAWGDQPEDNNDDRLEDERPPHYDQ